MRIERVEYGHPDAVRLIAEVQQEYVVRYGGQDDTPVDPLMFAPPAGSFFVAYDEVDGVEQPAASGGWRRSTEVEYDGTRELAEVKRMYVVPAARGRGLARAVLAHLEADVAAHGAAAVILESGDKQPEAIALYLSAGYEPIPPFGYYKDSPSNRCFAKRVRATLSA